MTFNGKARFFLVLCIICSFPLQVLGITLDLKTGTTVTQANLTDLSATSIPYAVARCGWGPECDGNAVTVVAFTNLGEGNVYYSLGMNMQIHSFDIAKKTNLGSWTLGAKATLCPDTADSCNAQWQALRWGADEVLEDAVVKRFHDFDVSLAYEYSPDSPGNQKKMGHPLLLTYDSLFR
jgi:hypothetical protein